MPFLHLVIDSPATLLSAYVRVSEEIRRLQKVSQAVEELLFLAALGAGAWWLFAEHNERKKVLKAVVASDRASLLKLSPQFSEPEKLAISAYVDALTRAPADKPLDTFAGALTMTGASNIVEKGGLVWASAFAEMGRNDIARAMADLAVRSRS